MVLNVVRADRDGNKIGRLAPGIISPNHQDWQI